MIVPAQRRSTRDLVALALALAACTDLEFVAGGGPQGGSSGTSQPTGAGSSVGGGAASTGGASPTGGAGGEGGVPPCQPGAPELCNGYDDDCDGIADDPPGGVGTVCPDQEWQLGPDGRLYVAIPTQGADVTTLACPTGMEIVVVQTQAELGFLAVFVSASSPRALVGATQDSDRGNRVEGWGWARPGMPMPWSSGEPNDWAMSEPAQYETNDENCGALYWVSSGPTFADVACAGTDARYVCEEIGDGPAPDAPCLLAEGCTGKWDAGGTCVPQPHGELCNGLDDDCNGLLDEDAACNCDPLTDPITGRHYKDCAVNASPGDSHCGDGYRLAIPADAEEVAFLLQRESMVNSGQNRFVGLYQPLDAVDVAAGWVWIDGTPMVTAWGTNQPGDQPTVGEQAEQNCGTVLQNADPGLHDLYCSNAFRHFCEEWP